MTISKFTYDFSKRKIMTVILDTDHKVHYDSLDPTRSVCRSYTTRIAEVENAEARRRRCCPPTQVTASYGA